MSDSLIKRDAVLYLGGTVTVEGEVDVVRVKLKPQFLLKVKVLGWELRSQVFPEEDE